MKKGLKLFHQAEAPGKGAVLHLSIDALMKKGLKLFHQAEAPGKGAVLHLSIDALMKKGLKLGSNLRVDVGAAEPLSQLMP